MVDVLPAVELNPREQASASVIWLHGLGADGHDFEPIVPELGLPSTLQVRFVFPHAPERAITINNGYRMRAWFDILEPGRETAVDFAQLLASATAVHHLIDREIERGIDSQNILLAGFSQGGAVALQAALTYDKPLAGLMALSTWFPTAQSIEPHPANAGLPIEIHHGTQDPILPFAMAENCLRTLEGMGFEPHFHSWPMAHSVCHEEVVVLARFLQDHLV